MNHRYLVLILFVIMAIVGLAVAKPVWSICDEEANPGCADAAKSQGYWNFQYDDAAPYTTAGLYCCWWERWYKWQKFSIWQNQENSMNLGSSDSIGTGSGSSSSTGSDSDSSATGAAVETKSFCPSCCATCDDEDMGALEERSAAIMAKKPWLTEGREKKPAVVSSGSGDETQIPAVMNFTEAV